MKFQHILYFAAAASFVFANGLEVSDNEEEGLAPTNEDAGINSEQELVDTQDTPADDTPASSIADDVAASDNLPADEAEGDKPIESSADSTPATEDSASGINEDAGEASDEYDEGKASGVAAADGEASDDYGNEESTDGANVNDLDTKEDELSDNDDDMSTETTVAAGLAGAAALSSAGIFLWVKRSKKSQVESSPLNMA